MKAGRAATSGILVVLAVGTLAYAYVFDGEHVSDADRASRARRVFPMFDVADVRSLTFEQEGQRVALERGADGGEPRWMLRSPVNEPADPAAVDALLEDMNVAARVRDVGSAGVAAGLSSPRVRATVRVGSIVYAFELGAPAPVPEGAAYLHMSAGADGTFVVDRLLAEDLLRGADAYRDHVLVPYGRSETSRIEIRDLAGDAGTVVLTRAGPTFRVEGGLRASRDAVERLFAGLAEVRAGSFVREGEGGAAGAGSLLVALDPVSSARARVELRLGGACPDSPGQIVVRLAGPPARTACAPASAIDAVRVAPEGIVDRGPFRAHADEVAELRLEPTGGTGAERAALDLARRASGWHERSPEDRDLPAPDAAAADALAARLTALRAASVRAGGTGEPFAPRSRVTLVGADGLDEVLEVGPSTAPGSLQARRLDDGAVLSLPMDAGRDLEARGLAP